MSAVTAELKLQLDPERESIHRLADAIEKFGLEQDWPPKLLFQTQLALEELVTNVIDYGFREGGSILEIQIASSPESLEIHLTDDAWPFNPLSDAPEANVDASLEDRAIGGLGVYLVRNMMDALHYAREDGKNHLRMTKRRDE